MSGWWIVRRFCNLGGWRWVLLWMVGNSLASIHEVIGRSDVRFGLLDIYSRSLFQGHYETAATLVSSSKTAVSIQKRSLGHLRLPQQYKQTNPNFPNAQWQSTIAPGKCYQSKNRTSINERWSWTSTNIEKHRTEKKGGLRTNQKEATKRRTSGESTRTNWKAPKPRKLAVSFKT